jgi:hypothetical protein
MQGSPNCGVILSHGIFVPLSRGKSVLLCGGIHVLLSCGIPKVGVQILTPLLSFPWNFCTLLQWNYCTPLRGIITLQLSQCLPCWDLILLRDDYGQG